MDPVGHLKGILSISACFWALFCLYICIRIERFIVKRYEEETDLLNTVYFKEHATFTRRLPGFFSSAIYTSHLLTFVWGWNYFRKKKPYRDIEKAEEVTRNFSKKELQKARWFALSGLIIVVHIFLYNIFQVAWPRIFT